MLGSMETATDPQQPRQLFLSEQRDQRNRAALGFMLTVVILATAGAIVIFAGDLGRAMGYSDDSSARYTLNWRIFGLVMLIVGLGSLTFQYASGGLSVLRHTSHLSGATHSGLSLEALAKVLDEISKAATDIKNSRYVTAGDQKIISEQLRDVVSNSLGNDFLAKIDDKYGSAIKNEKVSNYLEDALATTQKRLLSFQQGLSLKATSALVWALVLGALGLVGLMIFVFGIVEPPNMDLPGKVFHYAARLGFVALIEVVAFFFLGQYRATLLDEKYVNNEITNAEFRMRAAIAAAKLNNDRTLEKVLGEMSQTERNFALKKGETSIFHSGSGGDLLQTLLNSQVLSALGRSESRRKND